MLYNKNDFNDFDYFNDFNDFDDLSKLNNENHEHEKTVTAQIEYAPKVNQNYPYMTAKVVKEKKAHNKMIPIYACLIALCFTFSLIGSVIGNSISEKSNGTTLTNQLKSPNQQGDNVNDIIKTATTTGEDMTIEQVAALASNSVVEITTEEITTGNRMQQYVSTGAGSGVIISTDGYIVTNNHVIADANKITVTLKDGTQYEATLVGTDTKTDIAVVKIKATDLSAATFGVSSSLKVGQDAIAIGNPLGQLGGTVTSGIISALDREITIDGEVMNLLQTNAAINPGNSGGGLFNIKGELIGIVNAKSSGSDVEGLGFAIPVDSAKIVIEDLIAFGYVQGRIEIGMTLVDIQDSLTARMYRVNQAGVYVLSVEQGSSADSSGLAEGDRIISIDGVEIATAAEVKSILDKHVVSDKLAVLVERDGQTGTIDLTLKGHQNNAI